MRADGPVLPPKESPATVFLAATDQEQAQQGMPPLVSTQFTLENFEAFVSPWNKGIGKPGRRAQFEMQGSPSRAAGPCMRITSSMAGSATQSPWAA
jgi:hypothetical protein